MMLIPTRAHQVQCCLLGHFSNLFNDGTEVPLWSLFSSQCKVTRSWSGALSLFPIFWVLVQFSHSVVSDSLQPHELQHARPPCPSPTPGVDSNTCPSSRWCHPDISSSVVPFSSCPQSLLASGSFPMSQLFKWGGQSTGVSVSASVLPMNTFRISFRMDWLDLLAVQGTLMSLLQHHSSKASILRRSAFSPTLTSIHDYWNNHNLDQTDLCWQSDVSAF